MAAHIAAGHRLRRLLANGAPAILDQADAVVEPGGRVVHAEGRASTRTRRASLRTSAVAIERARAALRREEPDEALAIWRGLVSGRWSLIDQFDTDGRRYYVARVNDPTAAGPLTLSHRERQVAGYAAMGHSDKLIAYTLGLSSSTVSGYLASVRRKLGLRSRVELIALLAKVGKTSDEDP